MNKKMILKYLNTYLDATAEYDFKPCFNAFQRGQLTWIKIEKS